GIHGDDAMRIPAGRASPVCFPADRNGPRLAGLHARNPGGSMRTWIVAAGLMTVALPAAAQHEGHHEGAGTIAEGWQGRVDRETQRIEDVRFMAMGATFHAITGPHVVLWNPANAATGGYTATATFRQDRAPERPEGFGLIVGGRDLDGPGQDYLYFLIRHDGRFMVRHRAGSE